MVKLKVLLYFLIGAIISGIFSEVADVDNACALIIVALSYPILLLVLLAYIVFTIFFGIGVGIYVLFKNIFGMIKEKYKECTAQKK